MAVNTFDTLIKLHKHRLDLLRREMEALQSEFDQLEYVREKLLAEHLKEMDMIAENPEFLGFFGTYSKHIRERLEKIGQEIANLKVMIDAKRESIAEEFAEQKKYEIARSNQIKELLEIEKKYNQMQLDEIGIQQYTGNQ